MASYSLQHKGRSGKKFLLLLVSLMVVVAAAVAGVIWWQSYARNLRPVSGDTTEKVFAVSPGSSVAEIAANLERDGLIRSSGAFRQYVIERGISDDLQAGTYRFAPSFGVPKIAKMMVDGAVAVDLITLLPGQRIDQLRQAFLQAKFEPSAVAAAFNTAQYADIPLIAELPSGASLEGFLYPDSYQKDVTTTPQTIIRAALAEMQKRLNAEIRAAYAARGLSVYQAVTLASVVEREVGGTEDRAKVAQVFYKRLAEERALESDATAIYGAVLDGAEPSVRYDSSYNTYTNKGLPPTPISNVSESSLRAVAFPAATDWLYFVSGDDGTTYFSRTLAEHERLTELHCRELCSNP